MGKEAVKALREAKGRERAEKESGGEQEIAICVLRAQSDTSSIDNVQSRTINFGRQGHSLTQSKMLHCRR
jgi:hypothetical protein